PDNTIEFFPWITVVVAVKIYDIELAVTIDHHIAYVVVTVLIGLLSAIQQMSVLVYVVDKCLPVFIFQRTLGIFLYFVIHFTVEANFPILLRCRSRYGMNSTQNVTGFQTVDILLGI